MDEELLPYVGREQTYVKHQFLTKYLQGAAYKTLQRRSPVFNFVDAFAGPWRVEDEENYSDASFDQALRTLAAVKSDLTERGWEGLKIRFCFCEKRSDAAAALKNYARQRTDFEIHVFEGEFENNLHGISKALPDGFTFTFIDPTGWDIRNKEVFDFLHRARGEFLLNFMSDHINRHTGYKPVAASFGRFLADPSWSEEFSALPSELSNEVKVLRLLKRKMKEARIAKFLPDFSIMLPRQERVKMRLVLGTHAPEGLELFRDIQAKVEEQEMRIRHDIREEEANQGSLFSAADHVEIEQQRKGVGCARYRRLAEERIHEVLQDRLDVRYSALRPHLMEYVPIRKPQVNELVCEMKKRGKVAFDLPPRKRVPQLDTIISLPESFSVIE